MKTFPIGGVHPSENKLSCAKPIEVLPLPETVTIPLAQHIGAPAVAKVAKGDRVVTGQLIAEAGSFMSANIHSPISGTVTAVDLVANGRGLRQPMITIKREGDDWAEGIDRSTTLVEECTLSAQEIIAKIKDAGIVGMGGATFPTHVKLSVPPGKKAEVLIINGVECEPYLTSDHRTMLERGKELIIGVTILMKALDVQKAIIGIENNKPDAIAHLKQLVADRKGIKVQPLMVKYPQGGEKQLIAAVTGPAGSASARIAYRRRRRSLQRFNDRSRLRGCAEEQTADRACRHCHGQGHERTQKPADTHGYADFDIARSGRRSSGGCGQSHQRRPDDGSCDVQSRLARHEGLLGHHGHERPRRGTPDGDAMYQMREVRIGLPDGPRTVLPLEDDPEKGWDVIEAQMVTSCIECGSCQATCPAYLPLLDWIRLGKQTVMGIIRARAAAAAPKNNGPTSLKKD